MVNQRKYQRWALFLTMALTLLLTACGGKDTATSMRLVKTDGTVQVDNADGKSIKVTENLGLYSGYELTTKTESYGWITLDDTKLAKMDEESDVEIRKKNKQLQLYVRSGSLFFNVTEPLAEDETFDIRTSTMAVGIRGTCGWVDVADNNLMCVYLLRGKVECTVYDRAGNLLASETITAGQAAKMVLEGDSASITTAAFNTNKSPDFVTDALNHPEDWPSSGNHTSGTDESRPSYADGLNMFGGSASDAEQGSNGGNAQENPDSGMTQDVEAALEQYRGIVSQADSYTYDSWLTDDSDSYHYALVQMQTQYAVPALLLKRAPSSGMAADSILVFQYNPDTKGIIQASGTINESARNALTMAGDSNGVLIVYFTPSIGESETIRTSLNGSSLYSETLWQRNGLEDTTPDWTIDAIGRLSIIWYQIADTEGLDYWTPYAASDPAADQGTTAGQGTNANQEDDTDQWTAVAPDALEQYRTVISQADTYEYEDNLGTISGYRYVLFQEEGYSVPTLILKILGYDHNGFLLFRYDPETGTTDQIGYDYATRFEFPKHKFINEIPWDSWYDTTDSSGLDAWKP